MSRLLLICLGGAVGTGARYLLGTWIASSGAAFPWGTLTINALGSFLIAVIVQFAAHTSLVGDTLRLVLVTGVMGGFTTYSAFNYETLALAEKGAWGLAATNAAAMLVACVVAGALGWWLGLRLSGG